MTEFSVFIPGPLPPTTNQAYRCGKGRLYMTESGKLWKLGAQLMVQAANRQPEGFWKDKQLYVSLIFFDKSVLTADVDGRAKLALDAVAAGLDFDDRYVFPLLLDKKKGVVSGVSVLVTDRIPLDQENLPFTDVDPLPLNYICAACGGIVETPPDLTLIDSGTTFLCSSCGHLTVIDLETPRQRRERYERV